MKLIKIREATFLCSKRVVTPGKGLMFMGPCIVRIFQNTSNKMQRYTVLLVLYLETALHVSGGISTHQQESIQLYLQHLVFVTPLLSAAIVEDLEPV
jgi:hypothetical protein